MVVKGCDDIKHVRGDGGSTLLLIYGLLYDKVVKLNVLRSVLSRLLIGVNVI